MNDKTRFFTPPNILEAVYKMGPVVLDPCADPHSRVDAKRAIMLPTMATELGATAEELHDAGIWVGSGLDVNWVSMVREGLIYVNPPYGRKHNGPWGEKTVSMALQGKSAVEIISLVPASVGVDWWKHYWTASAICFLRGRVCFDHLGEQKGDKGTFDSAICYWGSRTATFRAHFDHLGKIIVL